MPYVVKIWGDDISDKAERVTKTFDTRTSPSSFLNSNVGAMNREGLGELTISIEGRATSQAELNSLRQSSLECNDLQLFYPDKDKYYKVDDISFEGEERGGVPTLFPFTMDVKTMDPYKHSVQKSSTTFTKSSGTESQTALNSGNCWVAPDISWNPNVEIDSLRIWDEKGNILRYDGTVSAGQDLIFTPDWDIRLEGTLVARKASGDYPKLSANTDETLTFASSGTASDITISWRDRWL